MTHYHPNYNLLNHPGVNISADESMIPQYNEATNETDIKGLYLAGVIYGGKESGKWFIENSREHALKIFNHIKKGK